MALLSTQKIAHNRPQQSDHGSNLLVAVPRYDEKHGYNDDQNCSKDAQHRFRILTISDENKYERQYNGTKRKDHGTHGHSVLVGPPWCRTRRRFAHTLSDPLFSRQSG